MRFREIILEADDDSAMNLGQLSANLIPVLMFLKNQADERGISATLRTKSLIHLVQNAGDTTFDYGALVKANDESDAVKALIKSFNKDQVTLKSSDDVDSDTNDNEPSSDFTPSPEETVKSMSKKALNRRS